jgi:uncharacterized protein YcfJ
MRTLVAFGIGAVAAIAISTAVAMTVNASSAREEAKTEQVAVMNDSAAKVDAADARAKTAEAKARRAEAKVACERDRQQASNRGAVVGGLTGAVIGTQVAGDGAKSEGGVLGGVAGVLAGRQIAKKDHRC